MAITFIKDNENQTYSSMNELITSLGGSGRNKVAGLKWLSKLGYEFVSEDKSTSENARKSTREIIYQKLIKATSTIDKEKIDKLENELLVLRENLTDGEQIERFKNIVEQIKVLKNPKTSLSIISDYVKSLWHEFNK
jgi:hypothetical protein